jgi:hypothetical protein
MSLIILLAVTRGPKILFLAVALALVAAGCGGGGGDAKPIAGEPKKVVAVVDRLDGAIRGHSWQAVCALFTPAALRRSGGRDCPRQLADDGAGVKRSRIRVLGVAVHGRRAAVKVRTRAAGQGSIDETIGLIRNGRQWQIESLLG